VGAPHADRMPAIFSLLTSEDFSLSTWVEWGTKSFTSFRGSNYYPTVNYDTFDDASILAEVLDMVSTIWTKQPEKSPPLVLLLVVADPSSSSYPVMELDINNPVLAYYKGSATTSILRGLTSIPSRCVLLCLGAGADRAEHAEQLAKMIRDNATSNLKEPLLNLWEIDSWSEKAWKDKQTLLVVVHGLLSTDIGTFDNLIDRFAGPQYRSVVTAGFPHNTLKSIKVNGDELAKKICKVRQDTDLKKIVFVAHSRGGLVVRTAATYIRTEDEEAWKCILGCLTFGTPHMGAGLATTPHKLIATCLSAMALSGTQKVTSIARVLSFAGISDRISGVEDLRPPTEGKEDEFLTWLGNNERGKPMLPTLAIGGVHQIRDFPGWFLNRPHGDGDHDGVVKIDSSIPTDWQKDRKFRTGCNHFSYFEGGQEGLVEAENFFKKLTAKGA
jgi:pimeloyl-ACP methyl ester carboxylesterase